MRIRRRVSNLFALAFGIVGVSAGVLVPNQKPPARPKLNYSRDILPILSDKCFKCHGPDSGSRMAELRLDLSTGAFADRQGRYAIVPGHPEHSLVVKRIHSTTRIMPPANSGRSLTKNEIDLITEWIAQGAVYGKLWSFTSLPASIPVPNVKGSWPRNNIDRFVLARMTKAKLSPSPEASKERWLRRVSYDLSGLPPTPQELASFVTDRSSNAFEKVVDRLLASPHFGERVAVDWLDAARYSDSYGYQSDLISPTWPYRDWVIKSFNENLPYDKFLTYQLAGDLVKSPTRDQRLATAFNRLHRQSNEGGSIALEYKTEYAADRVATFGTAMLGLTLGCARCHDHKFDPIAQKEYYQLFGYFNSIDEFGLLLSSEIVPTPSLLLPTPEQEKKLSELRAKDQEAKSGLFEAQSNSTAAFEKWLASNPTNVSIPDITGRFQLGKFEAGKFANLQGGSSYGVKVGDVAMIPGRSGRADDRAIQMDGDNGIAIKGLTSRERWDPFTWSFWIQDPRKSTTPQVLMHRTGGTDVGFCGFDLLIEGGHLTARVMRTWPGNAVAIRTLRPIPANQWTHVAWSWDSSGSAKGLTLYLNGERAQSSVLNDRIWKTINAYGDLGPGGGDWSFGQRFREAGFKGGKLADVTYADRKLSDLEVADLYDGVSLKRALSNPAVNAKQLRAYYDSAFDKGVRDAQARVQTSQSELAKFEEGIYEISVMEDAPTENPSYLLARGAYDAPRNAKTRVHRGVPKALHPLVLKDQKDGPAKNNRLALAKWTVRRDNPLTPRVAVNRFWQMLFGTGLVESSENFGVQGARPSNPELLDYLALKFIDSGWNVKALFREITLSSTYRQDSARTPKLNKVDPDNKFLARGPSFRLSGEMLRDTILSAAGLLYDKVGGPPVNPYQPAGLWTENNGMTPAFVQSKGNDLYRRSIYSTWKRTTPVPSMLLFDATSREACSVRRPTTNTPLQALVLLNDVQFVEASRVLAEKVLVEKGNDPSRIQSAFVRLAARKADARESALLAKTYSEQLKQFQADPKLADKLIHMGDSKPNPAIDPAALAAMTITVQTVLNSDLVVWRR